MEPKQIYQKYQIVIRPLIILAVFGLGAYFGYEYGTGVYSHEESQDPAYKEVREGGYKYTNPLLECDGGQEILSNNIRPFRQKIEDYIKKESKNRAISDTAVYFRDLNNGPWFGINEKMDFSPASMLKVPLMMSVLKIAETEPKILDQKIGYRQIDDQSSQIIKPKERLVPGKEYTMDELVYRMIVFSDNNSQRAIFEYIGDKATARSYSDLGLAVPSADKQENFMSVKNYASFFRILYNSSYLNHSFSEKALELLTNVDYRSGIKAGIPENIPVAHKFGERILAGGEKQFHDCGIVYYPGHPYLLCVMNRGEKFELMPDFIRDISSQVYAEMARQTDKND